MAQPQLVWRCDRCGKDVAFHYEPVRHLKQLLLTLMTVGLWLPLWLSAIFAPTKICNECGQPLWKR